MLPLVKQQTQDARLHETDQGRSIGNPKLKQKVKSLRHNLILLYYNLQLIALFDEWIVV